MGKILPLFTLLTGWLATAQAVTNDLHQALQQRDYPSVIRLAEGERDTASQLIHAYALMQSNQLPQAVALYKKLQQQGVKSPELLNNLAAALAQQGQLKPAEQLLLQGLQSDPRYWQIYLNLQGVYTTLAREAYVAALSEGTGSATNPPVTALQPILPPLDSNGSETIVTAALPLLPAEPLPTTPAPPPTPTATAVEPPPRPTPPPTPSGRSSSTSTVTTTTTQTASTQPASTTPPPTTSAASSDLEDIAAINRTIKEWQQAWQKQNITAYLAHYRPNYFYTPFKNHQQWQSNRRERILAPKQIQIAIDQLSLKIESRQRVIADFKMSYRADRYRDQSQKRLTFERIGDRWLISREESTAVRSR